MIFSEREKCGRTPYSPSSISLPSTVRFPGFVEKLAKSLTGQNFTLLIP